MSTLKTPTFSLKREGYKFILSFGNIDKKVSDSKKGRNGRICIEREVYEVQDKTKKGKWNIKKSDHKEERIGAGRSSWTYSLNKNAYYPYVSDGDNNKQSDLKQRISKIVFKVWLEWEEHYETITPGGQHAGYGYRKRKSKKTTKTYRFEAAVKPTVAISYAEDGTSLQYAIDINDDYGIDDNTKKVATRCWAWLTRDVKGDGKKAVKITGHTGRWYDRDTTKRVQSKLIRNTISSTTPVKYTIHAYSAGPGGKSQTVSKSHIFARPNAPKAPTFTRLKLTKNKKDGLDCNHGFYNIMWSLNTEGGWKPVDKVTIQYSDQEQHKGASDNYGEDISSWSTAKDNINSSIRKIMTDDIGAVDNDKVRYFRLLVTHDGNQVPSYVSEVVDYGKPSGISPSVTWATIYDKNNNPKEIPTFKWSKPASKLYNTTAPKSQRLRIVIFEKTTSKIIKTIYYGDTAFMDCEWAYTNYSQKTRVNFGFQVRVGKDNLSPGAKSDTEWISVDAIPDKITNVVGTKLANNTTCEVTWDNPVKTDTVANGIQIAWSEIPNVWETNSDPSTTSFENGAMTKAYVTGLSAGNLYYFWVRRYETHGDQTVYGLWSEPSEGVLMADDPDIPVLTLSRTWVKEGGALAAQWMYVASTNTPQIGAHIEYSRDNTNWANAKTIASVTGEEDHCDVDLKSFAAHEIYSQATITISNGSSTEKKSSDIILFLNRDWIRKDGILDLRWVFIADGLDDTQTGASISISKNQSSWTTIGSYNMTNKEKEVSLENIEPGIYYMRVTTTHGSSGSIFTKESHPVKFQIVDQHYLRVVVSNSIGSTASEPVEFLMATNPTCALTTESLVDSSYETILSDSGSTETVHVKTLKDSTFNVYVAGEGDLYLYLYVLNTFDHEHPDKTDTLYENDCIWSSPVQEGEYSIQDVRFADNCRYRLQLECTDPDTLLKAEPQYIDFEVHWDHQAVAPSDSKVIMGYALNQNGDFVLDDEGNKVEDPGAAYLIPVKPEGASDDDVCDIYRTTSDGRYLCRENVKWGQVVRDALPSFGDIFEHSYCFCTKTKDGDEAWEDISYDLDGTGIIINYGNDYVALPWNVSIDDKRSKQGETRCHLGGTKAYYAQPYVDRSQSISAEIVKMENEDLVEQLYDLSRFTDVCYVRTSNNIGYPAVVDVSINRAYNNQILSVSLDIKETEVDGEYLGTIVTDTENV